MCRILDGNYPLGGNKGVAERPLNFRQAGNLRPDLKAGPNECPALRFAGNRRLEAGGCAAKAWVGRNTQVVLILNTGKFRLIPQEW
jgi:hypothetical protein